MSLTSHGAGAGTGTAPRCKTTGDAPGQGLGAPLGGTGVPGGPQGATHSRRRLGSPWNTLALRQPMRLLERSLRSNGGAVRAGGSPLSPLPPGPTPGVPKGLYQHLQALQLREAEEGARLDCADQVVLQVPVGRDTDLGVCKSLISSFPSHFLLVISAKGAGKAQGFPTFTRGDTSPPAPWSIVHHEASHTMEHRTLCTPRGCCPPLHCSPNNRVPTGYFLPAWP